MRTIADYVRSAGPLLELSADAASLKVVPLPWDEVVALRAIPAQNGMPEVSAGTRGFVGPMQSVDRGTLYSLTYSVAFQGTSKACVHGPPTPFVRL